MASFAQKADAHVLFEDEASSSDITKLKRVTERLRLLVEVGQAMGKTLDYNQLLDICLHKLFEVFPQADRGIIVLYGPDGSLPALLTPQQSGDNTLDRRKGAATRVKFRSAAEQDNESKLSRTVVNRVRAERQSLLITDSGGDAGLAGPVAVDLGQGAPGAGFDGGSGVAGVEGGGSGQLLAGFGQIALTRQEQPEGEMGLKRLGIGIDGAAVEAGGRVQAVLGVGYVAGVEEGAGIGGMGGEPRVQFGFGGLPIGFDDGGLGVCDLGGNGLGDGLGCCGELLFRIRRRGLGEPGCRGEEQD